MGAEAPDLHSIAAALGDRGVLVLVLRGEAGLRDAAWAFGDRNLQILVRKAHVKPALDVLEPMSWRYSWVRSGPLRLLPMEYYWWDGGTDLAMYWGCPAAPLPSFALRALTKALWQGTARAPEGFLEPDPAALLVHLAVQACRPGRGHDDDWEHFLACRSRVADWTRVRAIARRAGVLPAVNRALSAADAGWARPGMRPLYSGPLGLAWRFATAMQWRARPARLSRLLAGMPWLGDSTIRCRVAGVEVLAGPGVFVPTPDADIVANMTIERVTSLATPTIVEVGTGCGAIALAVARARPDAEIHAIELSSAAVRWARFNAGRLAIESVRFYRGSLLDPLPPDLAGRVDVILANLPYYPAPDYASIGSVPRGTIQGAGEDGLDLLRQLARDALPLLRPGGRLLLQMFASQWKKLSPELAELGYRPGTPRLTGPFAICPADLVAAAVD